MNQAECKLLLKSVYNLLYDSHGKFQNLFDDIHKGKVLNGEEAALLKIACRITYLNLKIVDMNVDDMTSGMAE